MTFLELCQTLRREVGAAGTGPSSISGQTGEYARLVEWIRNEWLRIQERHERWNFAWAEGEVEVEKAFRDYDLPSDVLRIDDQTLYFNDRYLRVVGWEEFRKTSREPAGQEVKVASFSPDGKLRLNAFPSNDGTITFEYWKTPQRLEAGSEKPRCPEQYHIAIVYAAMVQYGLYENAPEVVQQGRLNYSGVYQEMINRELPSVGIQGPLA